MAQLSSVLCENPNVEVKEHLSLGLLKGKISQQVRSTRGEQAQVEWGWGELGVGIRSPAGPRPGVNVLPWKFVPQQFKWRKYVQKFKKKYSQSGEP